MLFLVLDPWIFQSICLQSYGSLTVNAVTASINVSYVSYKSCKLLWYAKEENIYMKYLCLLSQKEFSPGLSNLGSQTICA